MNQLPLLSAGVLCALAVSFGGLVLTGQVQQAGLAPAAVEEGEPLMPALSPGLAVIGKDVYISQGCVHCHTQQVRPAGQGHDLTKNWARRPSVARDYVLQDRVLLGESRLGPDLANVGTRQTDDAALHLQLFDPRIAAPTSVKPSYRHLYEQRPLAQARDGLKLPEGHPYSPAPGQVWVPTDRARALVAYLKSLRIDYASPEAPLSQ